MQQASIAYSISNAVAGAEGACDFIRQFTHVLGAPSSPDDGHAEEEIEAAEKRIGRRLPAVLRTVYSAIGRRKDLVACQDPLIPPSMLRLDDDGSVLIFRAENQGCGDFGFDWDHGDGDPMAMFRPDVADPDLYKWTAWHPRLSLACIEMLLSESWHGSPPQLKVHQSTSPDNIARIIDAYAKIPELDSPLSPQTTWFASDDLYVQVAITDPMEHEDPWSGPAPALAHIRARLRTEEAALELARMLT
ncbi:hypothetical protein ABZ912_58905 [Nonomuraea angiospora]|uniref:hypothetical protein n=1 Tax=Nonomuraea angiospora TaxID=46172 RepID=UPI0033E970F1